MKITIPKELETFIQEKVDAGRYRDTGEAISDGLRLLKQKDDAEFQMLKKLLKGRIRESKQGGSVPLDSKLRDQIKRRGLHRLRAGKRLRKRCTLGCSESVIPSGTPRRIWLDW
jgi:putative addiction module CopG family antidote